MRQQWMGEVEISSASAQESARVFGSGNETANASMTSGWGTAYAVSPRRNGGTPKVEGWHYQLRCCCLTQATPPLVRVRTACSNSASGCCNSLLHDILNAKRTVEPT